MRAPGGGKPLAVRILNPQAPRGWARLSAARYHALEVSGEPGVFTCAARGAGTWSEALLTEWARSIGAEVALTPAAQPAQHKQRLTDDRSER